MIVVMFSYTMLPDADAAEEDAATDRMWAIVSQMPDFISNRFTQADGYGPAPREVFLKSRRPLPQAAEQSQ